jgi:SOS-response transcriptional repressor LexA
MKGRVESGDLCTVVPITEDVTLEPGDIVLCKVRGNQYLHLIQAKQDNRFLIGNNRGGTNGWTGLNSIYGKCIAVEP